MKEKVLQRRRRKEEGGSREEVVLGGQLGEGRTDDVLFCFWFAVIITTLGF